MGSAAGYRDGAPQVGRPWRETFLDRCGAVLRPRENFLVRSCSVAAELFDGERKRGVDAIWVILPMGQHLLPDDRHMQHSPQAEDYS